MSIVKVEVDKDETIKKKYYHVWIGLLKYSLIRQDHMHRHGAQAPGLEVYCVYCWI